MSLVKAAVKTGGLCSVRFCKHSDVLSFPSINPQTGIMDAAIQLKEGGTFYYAEMIDSTRSFEEIPKEDDTGPYFEISVKGSLRGSSAAGILSVNSMIRHQWVVIAADRSGVTRLIGNRDAGAKISYSYTSGDINNPRKSELTFKWEHPQPAPIYTASAFDIVIGGITVTAGALTLLYRFQVGAAGAPMNDGDSILVNEGFKNKNLLILADGMGIPIDDFSGDIDWTGSTQRHAEHAPTSNTINFVGNVVSDEIIEIYAFTL